jgi:hypothetical protein
VEAGFTFGNVIEKMTYDVQPHIYFQKTEVYNTENINKKVAGQELWFGIFAEDNYYYLVTMLTPSREEDFYTWARNRESFEIIAEGLKQLE